MKIKTRNKIILGFNELIKTTEFKDITVEMIVKHTGVGKTTFYRYFNDKYDVANANFSVLFEYYLHHKDVHGYREFFVELFSYFQEYWKDFVKVFGERGYQSLDSFISRLSYSTVEDITEKNRNGRGITEIERLQMDVICFGVSQMVVKWISGDYKLDPHEAADALYGILPNTLKKYWL